MSQEWWVCTYCYRSNHPLWSKCQTCRAPRSQPVAYEPARHAVGPGKAADSNGASTATGAPLEPAPRPSMKAATKSAAAPKPASAPKGSRRKATRNGDKPDNTCPKCGQVMEAEWMLCPRCGRPSSRATVHELKLAPVSSANGRSLRRLGLVQPVPDLLESNGNHGPEEHGRDESGE
jgi:hypothetical protein